MSSLWIGLRAVILRYYVFDHRLLVVFSRCLLCVYCHGPIFGEKNQCKSHFHYMLFILKFNGVNAINNDKKIDYI